jgi:hypothetical protein
MEQNWYNKIEDYVNERLSPQEQAAMDIAIGKDPDLAAEVRVWQLERDVLNHIELQQKRKDFSEQLKQWEQQPEPLRVIWYRAPWVRVAAAVMLLLVVVWWYRSETQETDSVVDKTEVIEPIPPTPQPQALPDTPKKPDLSPNANFTLQIPQGVFAILQSYANTQTASTGGMESIQRGLDQAYTAGKYSVADSLSEKILQDQQMLDTLFEDSKSSLRFVTLSYFSKVRLGRDVQNLLSKCRDLSKAKLVNNSNMQFIYDWIEVLTLLNKPVRDPKEFKEKLDKLISRFPDHRDMDNSAGDFEKMLLSLQQYTKNK